jgi:hypothetical protein
MQLFVKYGWVFSIELDFNSLSLELMILVCNSTLISELMCYLLSVLATLQLPYDVIIQL